MDTYWQAALIDAALDAIRPLGLLGTVLERQPTPAAGQPDATLRLRFGGADLDYHVEAKRNLRPGTLGPALHQLARHTGRRLLIVDHVTPPLAEELRARGVEFIDTAGNAYLHYPPLLVWIKGQRPRHRPVIAAATGRAFQDSGLRVLFALLCQPEAVDLPYREIAALAGVAHGTVGWVMPELTRLGFVVELKDRRRLVDGERLLRQWVTTYIERLRPKLVLGRYATETLEWATRVDAEKYGLLLAGEPAAHRITGHLRPGTATFYGPRVAPQLLIDQRLRPDPDGKVEILKRFWAFDGPTPGLTPPVLVYADLLAIGDARCLEVAEEIHSAIADRLE